MTARWWKLAAFLLAGLTGCHAGSQKDKNASQVDEAHVTVRTALARLGTLAETIEAVGRCEALPDHLATLNPAVQGHVHDLLAKQGDTVKKGQPIVELDPTVARADFAEKSALRDSLKAALVLLKSVPRPEERRANELAVETAKVAVARADSIEDRLQPLLARHEVSEQQVFDAVQAVAQARLQQQTAEATLRAMMIGPRPEAVAEAESKIKTAEEAVAFSKAHLDLHTVRAPIDGVLNSLTCHPGQTIAIGGPIGEVIDTRQVYATVWLPTVSAHAVRLGQVARVMPANDESQATGTSASGGRTLSGKVDFVGQAADPQTGNLPVRVLVDNPERQLTLGETVHVTITLAERGGLLLVPVAAILDEGEGPVIGVVRGRKSVLLHPRVGTTQDGWVAVTGTDLKQGELVIVEGGYSLPEGTPVKVAEEKVAADPEAQR